MMSVIGIIIIIATCHVWPGVDFKREDMSG